MRILIGTPYLPWPLNEGGRAAQYSTLRCLSEDHDFTLVVPILPWQARHAERFAEELPRVRLRAVTWPKTISAAPQDPRWWRVLRKGAQWLLRWQPSVPQPTSPPPALYYPFTLPSPPLVDVLTEELSQQPDIVQMEFADFLPLGAALHTSAKKLFVHHQIHSVYADRFVEANAASPYHECLARRIRIEETAYLHRYDGVIAFSTTDAAVLKRDFAIDRVWNSPFPIPADIQPFAGDPPSFSSRLVFVGSEAHGPNVDALKWLMQEIWPAIRIAHPTLQLVVVGQWQEKTVSALGDTTGVSLSGFVEDLGAVLTGSILMVPLRIGSGIRTKILAGLAAGSPVVSSSVGCEGLPVTAGEHLEVCDTSDSFVQSTKRLIASPENYRRLAQAGRDAVVGEYSADAVRRRRNAIYEELLQ